MARCRTRPPGHRPGPAKDDEAAHEHAAFGSRPATVDPDSARPEDTDAPLRWPTMREARATATEANVRETLSRAARLLAC